MGGLLMLDKSKPSKGFLKRTAAYLRKRICDRAFLGRPECLLHSNYTDLASVMG